MGIIDPNKETKPDFVKSMYDRAVDTVTAPSSMVHNPGVALAGLGVGAVKNITDMAAIPLSVAQQAGSYLTGKGAVKPEDDLFKKYETASQNLAIDIGTLGNRDKLSATELQSAQKAAAGSEFLGSFIGMHGVGSKVPVLKGGLPGVAGEVLTKANIKKSKFISGAAKTLPDIVFQSMAKAQETGKKLMKPQDLLTSDLSSLINPKTATNIIAAKAPEAIVALSEAYNMPIAKIQDVGDTLFQRFKEENKGVPLEDQVNAENFVKAEVESILGSHNIDPQAKQLITQELTSALREKKVMAGNKKEAVKKFNTLLDQSHQAKSLRERLSDPNSPIEDIEIARGEQEILNQVEYDPIKLERAARDLRKQYEDQYIEQSIDPRVKLSKEQLQGVLSKRRQLIFNKLHEVDPQLAFNFDKSSTQTFVGRMGQFGNLFKAEPLFGDFTQINEALPITLIKGAEKLGVDPLNVARNKETFPTWYSNPKIQDVINKTIIEPNRTQFDAVYHSGEVKNGNKIGVGKKSIQDTVMDHVASVGMSNQIQFRQRLIENIILPEAYALVKAHGQLKEGTAAFNNAIMNHARNYIEESGMIPPEASVVSFQDTQGRVVTHKGAYDALQDQITDYAQKTGGLSKDIVSASNFMLKWVRGASQAKLKSWNILNESLEHITRTGEVTPAQKMLITNSVVDLVAGTILFGGRGLRIPGLIIENPAKAMDTSESPDTLGSFISGAIATILKMNPEMARELKDGLFYKATGLSSARTNNMPLPVFGQGNEIFSSIVQKKFGTLIKNIFTKGLTADYYTSREAFSDLLTTVVSQDTEIASDVNSVGHRYDSKGNVIEIDEEKHPLAHAPGVDFTKNMPGKDQKQGDVTYTAAQKNLQKKYSRLELKDLFKGDNMNLLIDDLTEVYPGNPTKIKTVMKKIIRDKLVPDSGDTFTNLATAASIGVSSGDYSISVNDPTLKSLTEDQVIEMAALSQVTQGKSKSVRNLLAQSGRLKLEDEKVMDKFLDKVEEIQSKVDKSLE